MRSPTLLTRILMVANAVVIVIALGVLLLLPTPDEQPARHTSAAVEPSGSPAPAKVELPSSELPPAVIATPEFARQVGANELGLVPVIMYHRIVKKRTASIDRTPSQVRGEMEKLARDGYVPITAREFATGQINIPAGKHPVVLTFDDGHPSHFALDETGMPARDTAVGIIYEVARQYPEFRPVATFWVNREPFGLKDRDDQARAVQWLASRGFEVANHTWSHPFLPSLSRKRIAEQLVRVERMLGSFGLGPSETLALPYGGMPRARSTVQHGKWDGTRFGFKGVFLAGAQPSVSPFDKSYDWRSIQRIQSNGKKGECRRWCSQYWLEWLRRHPDQLYTADGDPERISIPGKLRGNISSKRRQQVNAY
ncbi:xylanase [Planobispora siamensis]|uniref:Xylanase n=2 Tax=Planobispora siamensis TaxID=936338 RepID=A0A8J3SKX4_9ACTN|nr:xylanase [Planobispora siamensis]